MTDKTKNYLGWAIIISVLAIALSALLYVQTYSRQVEPGGYRSFTVSGEGKAVAVPDVAEFSFSAITEGGQNLATLQSQNTASVNKAIDYVKSQGVDKKDIQTAGYDVSPRYENSSCGYIASPLSSVMPSRTCPPPSIVGYTVTQSVEVKARDFTKVGNILSGVVTNGANNVSQLNFTVDDPTAVQDAARTQAIAKAKAKAESIASAGGFSLGRLISIEEGNQPVYYGKVMSAAGMDASVAPAPAPTIEPGSQETNVTVTLVYEIK